MEPEISATRFPFSQVGVMRTHIIIILFIVLSINVNIASRSLLVVIFLGVLSQISTNSVCGLNASTFGARPVAARKRGCRVLLPRIVPALGRCVESIPF